MTSSDLLKAIKDGRIPGLVYLYGKERFFLDRALNQILDASVPEDARDFNLQVFHGKETKADELLDSVRTLPVFSPLRLVLVKDADKLLAATLDALIPYLEDPVAETCLVLVGEKVDKRKKFFQLFQKKGALVEFKPLYENQVPAFVREQSGAAGFRFTEDAMALFCRRSGTSLQEIDGELKKLFQYLGDEKTLVDVEDVKAIVSDTRVDSIFDMVNAIGRRDVGEALRLLGRLLEEGVAPLVVLSMLARHFRQLWMSRELIDEGVARKDISRRIGVNPYFIDGLLSQAKLFSRAQYRQSFELLLATDLALKSRGGSPGATLEELLLNITGLKA
ncbi:MAG: DNA polymerase III subunit delta [Desulfuromonas sp.]|mgnify:CR=1 FL=1|nr:MAG: DNA polymerase III subunit delta [Desulfuromonas sp.]